MSILPAAPEEYDRLQEQKFRSQLEERVGDIEAALYALRTTYGTVSLGEGAMVLANGANNNVAPGYETHIRITGPTGAFSTTGFSGGEKGRLLLIANTVAQDWTLSNESGSSTDTNRIITGTGGDVTLTGVSAAVLVYDATSARWRVFATQG